MKRKSIISIVIALAFIFSCMPVYAASTPSQVKNVHKISTSACHVKVGWDKVKKAKKYQVYVSKNGKSGKYKKVKTTSSKSYNIKGGDNQTLWVKIRGINGKKKGKFSKKIKVITGKISPNYTVNVGNTFRVYLPSGYVKYLDTSQNIGFKSKSTPLKFINFSAETYRTLNDIRNYFSGSNKTYNGISGYEYSNGSEKAFAFESGGYLYNVEVDAKDPAPILHNVLKGLAW